MGKSTATWLLFALCLVIVLGAMAWLTMNVIRLDRAEKQARLEAELEEKVRLALWRMESMAAPIVARESALPDYFYQSHYSPTLLQKGETTDPQKGDTTVRLPSPLLTSQTPYILLHFQFEPGGEITSPQVPPSGMSKKDEPARLLKEMENLVDRERFLASLEKIPDREQTVQTVTPPSRLPQKQQQSWLNTVEMQRRTEFTQQAISFNVDNVANTFLPAADLIPDVLMSPIWQEGELFLVRRIRSGGRDIVQGCWVNWPVLKRDLLKDIGDLLPGADLRPSDAGSRENGERILASLPIRLLPDEEKSIRAWGASPLVLSLIIAWICALAGTGSVAALLFGAVSLSERRGSFVSAVTHELRTPLTTLRMYTEMLSEGMVSGEEKKRMYLETLRVESERLAHLVDNVLAYSRLERQGGRERSERIRIGEILERCRGRLSRRARQAGMELVLEEHREGFSSVVNADPTMVEQVLFNLVDNASKYAVDGEDRRIHLEAEGDSGRAILRVRDHGPGIPEREVSRLFRPFHKSAREAANSAPGVGLGLSLCRRLARMMGGDLRVENHEKGGASFLFSLPRCGGPETVKQARNDFNG